MLKIKKHGVILRPTRKPFEDKCVFNPAIYQEGETVHLLYRAMAKDFVSTIGYARLDGPTKVVERLDEPLYAPRFRYESKGIEDPSLVRIGDNFYMTYVAHDGRNAVIAYMYGTDLMKMKRGGIISTRISYRKAAKLFNFNQLKDEYYLYASFYEKYGHKNILVWEKDGELFPEKIKGRFAMLHRILPDIQLAYFKDFSELKQKKYWEEYIKNLSKHVVLEGRFGFQTRHIGGGAPPIKTKQGWLLINHSVEQLNKGRVYYATAALLELDNPLKVIAELPYPLISPEEDYEMEGHVNNVIFPTGTAIFKGKLYIYYGTSDSYVAVASLDLDELLKELLKNKNKKH
jgi:predicted GH43/DUF377 family glycosyl hydrolase